MAAYNHRRARHPITPGMEAMDRELALLREWGTEAAKLRVDRATNAAKAVPLYDARVALRDLQRQVNGQ